MRQLKERGIAVYITKEDGAITASLKSDGEIIIKTYDKTVNKTEYYKYRAPLPKAVAEESGLIDKELKITTKNNKIIIQEDKRE